MQPFHPITEKSCRSLVGKPVLVYLTNGSEIYGIVSRVEKNKLILNDNRQAKLKSASKNTKPTLTKKGEKEASPTRITPHSHDSPRSALILWPHPLWRLRTSTNS